MFLSRLFDGFEGFSNDFANGANVIVSLRALEVVGQVARATPGPTRAVQQDQRARASHGVAHLKKQ